MDQVDFQLLTNMCEDVNYYNATKTPEFAVGVVGNCTLTHLHTLQAM